MIVFQETEELDNPAAEVSEEEDFNHMCVCLDPREEQLYDIRDAENTDGI